jgi:hypothetical protein
LYVQFDSQPGVPLQLASLEDARQGIELVAVSHALTSEPVPRRIERATVFVPEDKVKHFIRRFEAYSQTTPRKQRERRYEDMLDPVAGLRLATLRGLWTDTAEVYPEASGVIWWEVWLRRVDGEELSRLMTRARRGSRLRHGAYNSTTASSRSFARRRMSSQRQWTCSPI